MTDFEIKIVNGFRDIITPFLDRILELLTILGEQTLLIVIIVIIYFIHSKKDGQRIAFAVFTSLLLNNAIKGLVVRVRPFNHPLHTFDASRVETATGYSFPSGHTQNAAVSYSSLALNFKRKWLWTIVTIIIFLVALSRIGLGVHYPTDVIVAIVLGLGVAIIADKVYRKFENNFLHLLILYAVIAITFLPFVFVFLKDNVADSLLFKDFYTSYAFFLGYIGAVAIERRFVDFDTSNSFNLKIIRTIVALIIVVALQFGLKIVFPKDSIPFDMIRYFLTSFIGLGIYPIVTKNLLFFKTK
jgi:membrane-associated phospholipid phosphatase